VGRTDGWILAIQKFTIFVKNLLHLLLEGMHFSTYKNAYIINEINELMKLIHFTHCKYAANKIQVQLKMEFEMNKIILLYFCLEVVQDLIVKFLNLHYWY